MKLSDMKGVLSGLLAALAGILLWTGCSVKENREVCPCIMFLDFSGVDTSVVRSAKLVMRSEEGFSLDRMLGAEDFRSGLQVPVPRGKVFLGISGGAEGMMTDSGLAIPLGKDCPPVYYHASEVGAEGETVHENVLMRKSHCVMTVNLNNVESAPHGITVVGNIDGYLSDGSPSDGAFSYDVPLRGATGNRVILPRQTDNSLVMDVRDGMGILRRFPIGEYISESGYDWEEPDLKDLTLDIDVAVTEVKLVIEGWDVVYEFEIVI